MTSITSCEETTSKLLASVDNFITLSAKQSFVHIARYVVWNTLNAERYNSIYTQATSYAGSCSKTQIHQGMVNSALKVPCCYYKIVHTCICILHLFTSNNQVQLLYTNASLQLVRYYYSFIGNYLLFAVGDIFRRQCQQSIY